VISVPLVLELNDQTWTMTIRQGGSVVFFVSGAITDYSDVALKIRSCMNELLTISGVNSMGGI